jgi:hypothetical protein
VAEYEATLRVNSTSRYIGQSSEEYQAMQSAAPVARKKSVLFFSSVDRGIQTSWRRNLRSLSDYVTSGRIET